MYLPIYSTPSAGAAVNSYAIKPKKTIEVPANEDRIWMILFNPGDNPVFVSLAQEKNPSFALASGEHIIMPTPVYIGKLYLTCNADKPGSLNVTEMLKHA